VVVEVGLECAVELGVEVVSLYQPQHVFVHADLLLVPALVLVLVHHPVFILTHLQNDFVLSTVVALAEVRGPERTCDGQDGHCVVREVVDFVGLLLAIRVLGVILDGQQVDADVLQFHQQLHWRHLHVDEGGKQTVHVVQELNETSILLNGDFEFEFNALGLNVQKDFIAYVADEETSEGEVDVPLDHDGMRTVDLRLELNHVPVAFLHGDAFVVPAPQFVVEPNHLQLEAFLGGLFIVLLLFHTVDVLDEQVGTQVDLDGEVFAVHVAFALLQFLLAHLLLDLAVRLDFEVVGAAEEVPLEDAVDHHVVGVRIKGLPVVAQPGSAEH